MKRAKTHRITFGKLSIENFKSVGSKVEFDWADHFGLNYIFGTNKDIEGTSNGSGKSCIFVDAILFAIFGKTLKNTNNRFISNRAMVDKKVDTKVSLLFEINGVKYEVVSTMSRYQASVSTSLFCEGEDVSKSTAKETRYHIEQELLKCNYELFRNCVILSSM